MLPTQPQRLGPASESLGIKEFKLLAPTSNSFMNELLPLVETMMAP
jgi:hypothetical protein